MKTSLLKTLSIYNSVMPYANVYVTNGGYGGVMMAIQINLPMVVGGVHNGKTRLRPG